MSTKTTIKRVALVAVAALGFGVMPVSPANAAGGIADSIALSAASTTIAIGSTASTTLTQAGFLAASSDSITATVSLTSFPTGATAAQITTANAITLTSVDTTTATVPVNPAISGSNVTLGGVGATYGQSISGRTTIAVTPTLAGVYTYKITPGSTTYPSTATALTWTVTVTAKAVATAATVGNTAGSTLVYGPGYGVDGNNVMGYAYANPDATSTAALVAAGGISCYAPLGYGKACIVGRIVLSNGATTAGAALTDATTEKLTYKVTGPATINLKTTTSGYWDADLGPAGTTETTETTANGGVGTPASLTKTFIVYTTGASGLITVTISSGTKEIAVIKATAFGDPATITPTVVNNPIAVSTTANSGTITAIVKDAAGGLVRGATVYAVSDTVATISNSYQSCGTTTSTGAVTCNLTGVAAGTANITLTTNSSATATGGVSSTPVAVRVSDGVATKVDYTFDKAEYAPGETAKITATVSNAAGVLPAGTYTVLSSAGVTANFAVSGLPAATVLAVGNTGAATYTVAIPTGITGDLQLAGTAAATTITATFGKAAVVNAALDAANAATDAAAEATDAANAATDAANAAAEAADAATAAAQDAADAVAALSTSVAAMIDALKKQITALTNLVIKIQKKVKA